jgi:hypothetical protein
MARKGTVIIQYKTYILELERDWKEHIWFGCIEGTSTYIQGATTEACTEMFHEEVDKLCPVEDAITPK